ncbi:uncharacterized protein [Littorina saxatilis]|uniref:NAD-dependent epimerase/dehydratase domain-containing protein n=1 Tax=Littorina saxatilis TaxID=31220 RepID=A0AAN9ANG2_9CAEN
MKGCCCHSFWRVSAMDNMTEAPAKHPVPDTTPGTVTSENPQNAPPAVKTSQDKLASDSAEKILVTGASGYLAGHVVKQLQEAGHVVRGTVRCVKNADKVKHLYNLCPDAKHKLELVEADLNKPESWEPAVSGMTYVIHVASPYPLKNPEHEEELIKPAVEGTLNVLEACAKAGTVKRVVLTSSCVAIDWTPGKSHHHTRDEAYCSDPEMQDVYSKSKTLAERAAWNFMKEMTEQERFELAVINPALMMGPPLQGSACTSVQIMQKLLERQISMLPRLSYPMVDVRDVALAHVRAMTCPEAAAHRHICSTKNMWFSEIGILLKSVFGPQGYNVPTSVAPKVFLRIAGICDSSIKRILPEIGVVRKFDHTRMQKVLEIEPHNIRDTLVEMAYALIESGFVKKTKNYRGPGGPEERERYLNLALS